MNYTTKQLAEITHSELLGDGNIEVKNIAFDSRNIYASQNVAFLAVTTSKNSGEKYIQNVIEKGVKVIIAQHKIDVPQEVTWIITNNAIDFIQLLAKHHLQKFPNLNTIGITGSNGKTIVKEWIYQTLSNDFQVVKSPKSFNSQLGLPISLLQIKDRHEIGIFEVGISKPNEMQKLEDVFAPKIGILTHIGSAHSANFKNEIELIHEKISLFKDSNTIIYNGDNDLTATAIHERYPYKQLISFGLNSNNNVTIISDWKDKAKDITVRYFDEEITFPVAQRDEATLANALSVIAVLKLFNFNNGKIIEKINALKAVEMRLESLEGIRNNLIINDSYNLDLDSLVIAYQFVNEYKKESKALIITDFLDGKNIDETYHQVVLLTNEQNFDKVFLVGNQITNYESLFHAETYAFENTQQLIESQQLNAVHDSLILLKGARKFEIEKVKYFLELQKHETILEINLNAILNNINIHKALLKPETKMMAMVKAFSYGLGGYEIAEFLQHHHIDYLTVAYADEGVDLRKNGITTPIMVMNPEQYSYDIIAEYKLEPEIYSFRTLELFVDVLKAKGYNGKYPIHIKLETGMHRLGFKDDELDQLVEKIKQYPVKVQSIFSHLATADIPEEKEFALQQIKTYEKNSLYLIENLGYQPIRHILNSSGITNYTDYQYDMVRIGIGMIGIASHPEIQKQLQSAVSFKTVISQISEVKAGESVGYSRKFRPTESTKIATIPVGYADGIPRLIGNQVGNVGIHHQLVPIVGNVCMDMMMINIGNLPAKEGDEVVIFNSNPSLQEFAKYCNTIPYEVLTSISRRVKRVYIKN